MSFLYDILLNFSDSKKMFEFYEWEENDNLINVKKIPIIRVSTDMLLDIYNYKLRLNNDFLSRIENLASVYKQNKSVYKYLVLVSDCNKAIALDIASNGIIKNKSNLLLDEEEEALFIAEKLEVDNIEYRKLQKEQNDFFKSRREQEKKDFLLKEIKKLYKDNSYEKLRYLHFEYFDKLEEDIKKAYDELIDSLDDITDKHDILYELLKLACKK